VLNLLGVVTIKGHGSAPPTFSLLNVLSVRVMYGRLMTNFNSGKKCKCKKTFLKNYMHFSTKPYAT
jgi:hypothetical protein